MNHRANQSVAKRVISGNYKKKGAAGESGTILPREKRGKRCNLEKSAGNMKPVANAGNIYPFLYFLFSFMFVLE